MSPAATAYLAALLDLVRVRVTPDYNDSVEDAHLDHLDVLWWPLTEDDRTEIEAQLQAGYIVKALAEAQKGGA